MAKTRKKAKPSPFADELKLPRHIQELRTQYLRVKSPAVAMRMWERMLTDKDKERLGGDLDKAYQKYSTAGMWMKLRGVSLERALIDVAHGTGFLDQVTRDWLLREVGQRYDDSQRTVDEAIFQNKLVLTEKPKQAFWNGEPIEIDWDGKDAAQWNFFWELSRKRKRSQTIDHMDIGEKATASTLSTRKGRLVNHPGFPSSLKMWIKSKKCSGYWLDLPPQDIRIFLVDEEGKNTEWTG
jgi:hypothetical protein